MRVAPAGVALLLLASCGSDTAGGRGASPAVTGTVRVFAAASLTDAFGELARRFEAAHRGARVELDFGGSNTLATQLAAGAVGEVFAAADEASMRAVAASPGLAGSARDFATNRLEIAVPPGNPRRIHSLSDLAAPGLAVVLCAPAVPCGAYAHQALAAAGVAVTARSLEPDVKGVVEKVALGEADAGIVYATDVVAAGGRVDGVEVAAADNVMARYPVALLKGAPNAAGAAAFVALLLSSDGQAILHRHGFSAP